MLLACLCKLFLRIRGRFVRRFGGRVLFFPKFGLVLKVGDGRAGAEADTLRYVRKNTTIPVPRVFASDRGFGRTYMLMEEVRGDDLDLVWAKLSPDGRASILAQLGDYVRQLRALQPPPSVPSGAVCSLRNEAFRDSRITSTRPLGPFANEAAFNDCLIKAAVPFVDDAELPGIRARMRDDHRIVFTHGDLAPRNIIVDGDRIAALIDWEESGWYPEHWELVKALWYPGLPVKDLSWNEAMKDIVGREQMESYKTDYELSSHLVGGF